MEEKRIIVTPKGRVEILSDGSIGLVGTVGEYASLGTAEAARQYARAILELCGEAPKGEPKGDDCYIAVTNSDDEYSWARGGEIVDGLTDSGKSQEDAIAFIVKTGVTDKEFHIFRRVATVGPVPQPERKVTRYE